MPSMIQTAMPGDGEDRPDKPAYGEDFVVAG